MSAIEKQSYAVDDLDCEVVRGFIERLNNAKQAVDVHLALLAKARANFDGYMARLAAQNGVDVKDYRVNFATKQMEPVPTLALPPAPEHRQAPDSDLPPAPFKDPNTP